MGTYADMMIAEGVFQIRSWHPVKRFSVVMDDKRTGDGKTIREAINNATHERLENI